MQFNILSYGWNLPSWYYLNTKFYWSKSYIRDIKNFPLLLIKWGKIKFKIFFWAQFWKFRNRINGVGEFRLNIYTWSQNFASIGQLVWKLLWGTKILHRDPFISLIMRRCTNKNKNYRAIWFRGNARDSHWGGPGFKSRCRPTWLGFFRGSPQSSKQMLGWISLPRSIWPLFIKFIYIIKLKSVNLTKMKHWLHNNRNTQPSGTHTKTLDAMWPRSWSVSK